MDLSVSRTGSHFEVGKNQMVTSTNLFVLSSSGVPGVNWLRGMSFCLTEKQTNKQTILSLGYLLLEILKRLSSFPWSPNLFNSNS